MILLKVLYLDYTAATSSPGVTGMQSDPAEAALNMFANTVSSDGVILPVEPSDLKQVWKMTEEIREHSDPNVHVAIDVRGYADVCSPGANMMAIWYRASMLGLIAEQTGLFAPELPEEARDVVFDVAAKFPIKFMRPGVVHDGLPVDVEAFVKQVEDELHRLGFKI
jgi:hypothetical protein